MTDKDAMDNIRALHCGDYNCQLPDNELDNPDFWCKSKNCEGCFNYLCYTALQERIARKQSEHFVDANKSSDNPPLTLEELRGMEGKTVYVMFHIKPLKSLKRGVWINWASSDLRFSTMENFENQLKLKDYGESWIAYRYKPEEDEKNEKTH